jgi:hypothetical protein
MSLRATVGSVAISLKLLPLLSLGQAYFTPRNDKKENPSVISNTQYERKSSEFKLWFFAFRFKLLV